MDLAKRPADGPLLTTADLAAMADFTLGGVIVSPATRTLRGPLGSEDLEPRVMQVLVVLAEVVGQVVIRETLFNRCWGGVYVGDDSLNRAIAALRRAVEAVGGRFEVETIPRTGYRLVVPKGEAGDDPMQSDQRGIRLSRRGALAATGAAAVGAVGLLAVLRVGSSDERFDALMARGKEAMRTGSISPPTTKLLEEAVRIRPHNANAWGLLAYLMSVTARDAAPNDKPRAVAAAEDAARKALAIDPKEPNALLAMFGLQGSTLDWVTRDQRLRQIIAIDPTNIGAIAELVLLLQAAGLNRESWKWNERSLQLEPLSADFLGKRALKLWIAGRVSESDKVIDQLRALYPTNPWPWQIRFLILALTGRPRAAQAMLAAEPGMVGSAAQASIWRACLVALDRRSPKAIVRAREACINGAKTLGFAAEAVMILGELGEVDAAFDITNGYLLSRGTIIGKDKPGTNQPTGDASGRINTQWLFTPPCATMRGDARFLPLCDGVGLTDYWRSRGVHPDYQLIGR